MVRIKRNNWRKKMNKKRKLIVSFMFTILVILMITNTNTTNFEKWYSNDLKNKMVIGKDVTENGAELGLKMAESAPRIGEYIKSFLSGQIETKTSNLIFFSIYEKPLSFRSKKYLGILGGFYRIY
jgi:hypothetical protein